MKTPIFIHKEKISEEAVKEVIKFFKKNQKYSVPGKIGNSIINNNVKKSTDVTISSGDCEISIPKYMKDLKRVVQNYHFKYPETFELNLAITEGINIQLYQKSEGFFKPHCEKASLRTSSRVLVFMTYLSDNINGGTYFKYQNYTCPAVKGETIIWPSDWTFMHNGIVDFNQQKMIITGWINLIN